MTGFATIGTVSLRNLVETPIEELRGWLQQRGEPAYRARQILDWVHAKRAESCDDMTSVGKRLRRELAAEFTIGGLPAAVEAASADGTIKLLFELPGRRGAGRALVESVVIPRPGDGEAGRRLTVCVSTQAGCAMGCTFCATARLGLERNLSAGEILGQVRAAASRVAPATLTNVVFMGMGEPLANWPAVRRSIDVMTADWGQRISKRRVTVSTVGVAPLIPAVVAETGVNLAISLHATTDAQRERLIPLASRYRLADLLDACRRVPIAPRARITFEYVLLAGENDDLGDARRLVSLLHGIRSKVNLLHFNPFPGAPFAPSPPARVAAFQQTLLDHGIAATIRESRGADIAAACGQLAARSQVA